MTIQCCKCLRVKSEGQWMDPPQTVGGHVSHTYCPACLEQALRKIRAEFSAAAAQAV